MKVAAAPNATTDLPWLLIQVQAEGDNEGALTKMAYLQRVSTTGGKVPAETPVCMGTKVGMAHKAPDYFYGRTD